MKTFLLVFLCFLLQSQAQKHHPSCCNITDSSRSINPDSSGKWVSPNASDTQYFSGQSHKSFIDNFTYNYIHKATDYEPVAEDSLTQEKNNLASLKVKRYWRSRDATEESSFGIDGHFWNFDINLTLYDNNGQTQIDYFNINRSGSIRYHLIGDVFKDTYYEDTRYIELLKADGSRSQTLNDAVSARLLDFLGNIYTFEIFELDGLKYGRLKTLKDRNGYGLSLTYFHAIDASLASNRMKWMVKTVEDAYGRHIQVEYLEDVRQSRYVVSKIILPNSQIITYNYGTNLTDTLESVEFPDGSRSSFSLSVDPDDTSQIIREFCDAGTKKASSRNKKIYLSTVATLSRVQNDGLRLFNQSSQLVNKVINGSGELTYESYPITTSWRDIYEGGGVMKQIHSYKTQYYTSWTNNNGKISGNKESTFAHIPGTSWHGYHRKRANQIVDEKGQLLKYTYNEAASANSKIYPDGRYESRQFDSFQNPEVYIDPEQKATRMTYDSQGNIIQKEVGLLFKGFESPISKALSYFPLDEKTGSTFSDSKNLSGSLSGTYTLNHPGATTESDSSIYLDGSSGDIAIPNDGRFDLQEFSMSLWMKPDWSPGSNNYNPLIVGLRDGGPSTRISVHMSNDLNKIYVWNGSSCTKYDFNFTQGQWYQFTVSWKDGLEKIYVNNRLLGESQHNIGARLNSTFHIGSNGTSEHFKGAFDNVRFFASEISPLTELTKTEDHASYRYEYYPDGHQNQHRLHYEWDTQNNRREYIYNNDQFLIQINEPDNSTQTFIYDSASNLESTTNIQGQQTQFLYGKRNRLNKVIYHDNSTEIYFYGKSKNNSNLLTKIKDRQGKTSKKVFDDTGRIIQEINNYSLMNADGTTETVNPEALQSLTETTYLHGREKKPLKVNEDGYIREYTYDHRLRVLQTTILAYCIKFSAGENGTVSGKVKQSIVPSQDSLPVTAIPNSNYYFVSWSDGNTDNPRVLTNVTANKNLTATFAINTYTLAFTAGENGTITGNANQTINHAAGSTAVTAVPNLNYHFVSWSDGNTDNPRILTNVTENKTLTATFAINTYTLAFTAGENGTITGDLNQTINHAANSSSVTAIPNTGYHFVSWSDSNTNATRTFTNVSEDKNLNATFAINTYSLAFTAGENGTITGSASQTINHGANSSSVTATPNSGYQFEKWSDNSTNNPRTITNVTANQNLNASFKIIEQTPISGIIFSQEFEHDQLNRRNKVTQLDQSKWSLTYDSKSNLKSALKVDVDTNQVYYFQYTYDDIGNRITKNQDGVIVQYTANALNQYTSIIRDGITETQQYDADANPLNIRQWVMTWDFENRMTSCTDQASDTRLEFAYSFDHMRAWKKVIINGETAEWIGFVYKGRLLIAEIDLLNERKPIRTYTWGLDPAGTQQQVGGIGALLSMDAYQPDGSKKHYRFINDASGNIVKVLEMHDDDTITVANSYEYGPFGQVIAKSET